MKPIQLSSKFGVIGVVRLGRNISQHVFEIIQGVLSNKITFARRRLKSIDVLVVHLRSAQELLITQAHPYSDRLVMSDFLPHELTPICSRKWRDTANSSADLVRRK